MERCKIIEKTDEAKEQEGWLYGGKVYKMTKQELEALLAGKCLSTDVNDEYRIFIELEENDGEK